ncbi:unnamed protein product [Onchocerca ochengi]|uniref:Uncharacterized protein n=1 Tax=Onchocerca ochengi TaxID=42157 RepID=A0A182EAM8_ONCOC|nr:unnamed protein product [Onchocerca ochengi]
MQKDTSSTVTNNNYANYAQATFPFRAERNWQRFGGRWRGGRSFQYSHRNQPVFFGPFAEFSSPPPAVFDIPPRILPANMFNANVVPFSERDAHFDMQFAPFMNHSSPHYFDNNIPCFYENARPLSLNDSGTVHPSSSSSSTQIHRSLRDRKTRRHKMKREDDTKLQHTCQELSSEQLSRLNLEDEIVEIQEGYGCPPSYIMESYRDQTDLIVAAGNTEIAEIF